MIGLRIESRTRYAPRALIERFASLSTANLSDCMNRLFDGGAGLKPLNPTFRVAGPALTVRVPPGDNLMVQKALDLASPGDVVVVDAGGQLSQAIVGDLMILHAQTRGLGAIVVQGAVRDSSTLRSGSFPVFALGITPRGPYKNGPGEINCPISIGGMPVEPGDVIVGDSDGLISIPLNCAEEILLRAEKLSADEEHARAAISAGARDRGWVDDALRAAGYVCPSG